MCSKRQWHNIGSARAKPNLNCGKGARKKQCLVVWYKRWCAGGQWEEPITYTGERWWGSSEQIRVKNQYNHTGKEKRHARKEGRQVKGHRWCVTAGRQGR